MALIRALLFVVLSVTASSLLALQSVDDEDDRIIDLQELLRNASDSLDFFRKDMKDHVNDVSVSLRAFSQEMKESIGALSESFKNVRSEIKELKDTLKIVKDAATPINSFGKDLERIKQDMDSLKVSLEKIGSMCNKTSLGPHRDCADILKSGKKSGIYKVLPLGAKQELEVYCDMDTDGGGWTVFQKRGDFGFPDDFFFKSWEEYKYGFGDLNKEFWLGNDHISAISSQGTYELRIDLWDQDSTNGFVKYDLFRINDEEQQYRLHVHGYSGNLGDSLGSSNTMRFTTKDRDNDIWTSNCAVRTQGAWWYPSDCGSSNLNGLNLKGRNKRGGQGIVWSQWKGDFYSLSYVQMKIRPKEF